jgi:hypothetical protein
MKSSAALLCSSLAQAAANDRAAVHKVSEKLLPLLDTENFLHDGKYSIKVVIAGQEVETKNARETVLLRLGALTKAVAPDLYHRYGKFFDERLAPVKTLDDALNQCLHAAADYPIHMDDVRFRKGASGFRPAFAEFYSRPGQLR